METALLHSPETTIAGSGLLLFGYLCRVHHCTFLIAGFEESTSLSKRAVAETVGLFALWVGIATIAFGTVAVELNSGFGWYGIAYAAVVFLATLRLVYQLHTPIANRVTVRTLITADS